MQPDNQPPVQPQPPQSGPVPGPAPAPTPMPGPANYPAQPGQPGQPPQPGVGMQQQIAQAADQQREQQAKEANNQTTSQKSLLFSELRDGMIIMSDGGFRAVVACESINFDLMSNREREAIEFSYQDFLNSLLFPIQIYVRSQNVDIAPYLERLDETRRSQDNMLLNVLMTDYIDFIDNLSQEANIMEKSFYIVIPYNPAGDATKIVEQSKGFFGKIFGGGTGPTVTKIDQATYDKAKDEIGNRVESVLSGLNQVGVRGMRLNTKQLGELYYNVYNPDTAVNQPLPNFENMTNTYVRKGEGTPPPLQHISGTGIGGVN